jgi:hypothetical protein
VILHGEISQGFLLIDTDNSGQVFEQELAEETKVEATKQSKE